MPNFHRYRTAGACLAVLVALLVVATSLVTPVFAQTTRAQNTSAQTTQTQDARAREQISEDAAVAMVREQTHGKVLRVDRKIEDGMLVYQIRVLSPDGRLREFRVDAATGAIR